MLENNLTLFACGSHKSGRTDTCEEIVTVSTCSIIDTRIAGTLVSSYGNTTTMKIMLYIESNK